MRLLISGSVCMPYLISGSMGKNFVNNLLTSIGTGHFPDFSSILIFLDPLFLVF